ncbi:MAG TPA: helix-turn-helix domain-containing protein [Cyclobacteriaceae bacterium]|nr:helix-turn-helix domain-containing protein [Cyclobacteriaceae bacterium]
MSELILVLCWLGVVQSILLGVYFLSNAKDKITYLFLGLTLMMIGVRVAKSTIYLFNPDPPLWIMNIGFAAHALLGPLFLIYIQSLFQKSPRRIWILLQFIPAIAVLVLSPFLSLNDFWYRGGYSALLYYTLIYLVLGWSLVFVSRKDKPLKSVILILLITITIFQVSYFSNYILRLTPYEAGAVVHSLLIYLISFLVLKDNNVFNIQKKKKYDNLNLSEEEVDRYKKKLIAIIESQKPYLNANFSLAQCASLTGIPTYILSYVLSNGLNQNFVNLINSYRVEEAKKLLVDSSKQHISIAGIAHDCGFNTLSSFNSAFKKFTNVTPSDYRKKVPA